jgi:hypothetical protein
MDYIVSAEDTPYHHWQLELLIESFKRHGQQARLLVALAPADGRRSPDFTRNITAHGRIMTHENVGRQRGYLYFNKPYAVAAAVRGGLLRQPFAVIDPDMVLFAPLAPEADPVCFQVQPTLSLRLAADNLPGLRAHARALTGVDDFWLPVGNVYAFNGAPEALFARAMGWAERLAFEGAKAQAEAGQPVACWRYLERAAWALAFMECLGRLGVRATHTYEMTMRDHGAGHNFVHYSHGQPPGFSKYQFKFEPPDLLAAGRSPFAALAAETPTSTALYVRQVVDAYLAG